MLKLIYQPVGLSQRASLVIPLKNFEQKGSSEQSGVYRLEKLHYGGFSDFFG
jgi:hypothetical protein